MCSRLSLRLSLSILAACFALAALGGAQAASKKIMTVYVPCGMVGPFGDVIKGFEKQHPDVEVRTLIANVIVLRNRVRDGARPEVLLTLGMRELKPLMDRNLIPDHGVVAIGSIPLAIVVPKGNPGGIKSFRDLASKKVKTVAVGDPKGVSVGYGAMTAMQKIGIWNQVQAKSVTPSMPSEVMDFVAKRKVDASVVYKPCLMEDLGVKPTSEMRTTKVQYVVDVPSNLYDQIACGAAAIKGSQNLDLGMDLVKYLGSNSSKAVFRKWWFGKLK